MRLLGRPSSQVLFGLALLAASAAPAAAQQDGTPKRGFQSGGSYAISDIETINITNGNLILNIPLASLPAGRGTAPGAALRLLYNSKLFDSRVERYSGMGGPTEDQCISPSGLPIPCDQARGEGGDDPRFIDARYKPGSAAFVRAQNNNINYTMNLLGASGEGGWRYGIGYQLVFLKREQEYANPNSLPPCPSEEAVYRHKLKVAFPDGSLREFQPTNFNQSTNLHDGYYAVNYDGFQSACPGPGQYVSTTGMTYHSTDGTYLRLFVGHDGDSNPYNNPWELSLPDGGRVTGGPATQRVYDRNNNFTEIKVVTLANGHTATQVVDQLGRSFLVERGAAPNEDHVVSYGTGGQELRWRILWKTVWVYRRYTATQDLPLPPGVSAEREAFASFSVVDRVVLPTQAGALAYTFTYGGAAATQPAPGNYTPGWGEVTSVTLPSGAQSAYRYLLDNQQALPSVWTDVLQNSPTRKDLTYQREYEDDTSLATETWHYNVGSTGSNVVGPDGGVTAESFGDVRQGGFDAGLVYKTVNPDGAVVERLWRRNVSPGSTADNPYVKAEFTSLRDAAGNLARTAIKDYEYDKNGNVTRVRDYDWVGYASVQRDALGRPTGELPASALRRVTTNAYHAATPDASDTTTANGNTYVFNSAPTLRNAVASTEVSNGSQTLSRTEFAYDSPTTTGNLTEQKSWDSTRGGHSNPLHSGNSVSVSHQYDSFGGLLRTTDARGVQTHHTYGAVGGQANLYPTETRAAYNTPRQRTSAQEYDFHTGLVTRVTDADNQVSTSTAYDAFGRPTLVRAAEGKSEETRTRTVYDDALRRVVVRADLLHVGDEKLVSVQHYDRLGRLRLARRLENASAQSAENEAHGIKVQTRYRFDGAFSHEFVSQPYRGTSPSDVNGPARGWAVTKRDRGGRVVEAQTFQGGGVPVPWGTNASGAGKVTTSYDAEFMTVTDQAGKVRRSMTDGLGRLARVDEPDANGDLGPVLSPAQPTSYFYDALGNLRRVGQGAQSRYFMYDSLSRVVRARNPEQGQFSPDADFPALTDSTSGTSNSEWSTGYTYDATGHILKRKDPRNLVTSYAYDELGRNTSVVYSNDPNCPSNCTPSVTRRYDSAAGGKGQPWQTETGGPAGTRTTVTSYDALGRPREQHQQFLAGTWGTPFVVTRTYDRAGHVLNQGYPSGRSISYTYDVAGRLASLAGNLGGQQRTYADGFSYDEHDRRRQERLGTQTSLYNKSLYNAAGQLSEIRVSTFPITSPGNETDWNRGAIINHYSDQSWAGTGTDNNGNLRRQDIYVPGHGLLRTQHFFYDSLNRLDYVTEDGSGLPAWRQDYKYDRWGNRTFDRANTTDGLPEPDFDEGLLASANRLHAPGDVALPDEQRRMRFDAAGNLVRDTYTGAGVRAFDAENRMTSAQSPAGLQTYTYDADGRRVRRGAAGSEVWQVYGMDGELLAEYAQGAAPTAALKEYGYRAGDILVVSEGGPTGSSSPASNLALNKPATQSSDYGAPNAQKAVDGNTSGDYNAGSVTHTGQDAQAWWQVDLGAVQSIQAVKVFNRTDGSWDRLSNFHVFVSEAPFVSTDLMATLGQPGVSNYHTPGQAGTSMNINVGRTGRYVRVQLAGTNYLSLAEVEVIGTSGGGSSATAPFVTSTTAGTLRNNYTGWVGMKFTTGAQPVSVTELGRHVVAGNSQTHAVKIVRASNNAQIATAEVATAGAPAGQYKYTTLAAPVELQANTAYYLVSQETSGGDQWYDSNTTLAVSSVGAVNCATWSDLTSWYFTGAAGNTFVPASFRYAVAGGDPSSATLRWLVVDHLGTTRMVLGESGALADVSRHDYFPFGEELSPGIYGRTAARGYAQPDGVRQRYTGHERDDETGLDFMQARYYSNMQGRFTSPDDFFKDSQPEDPQSWNKYAYVRNNPLKFVDPTGEKTEVTVTVDKKTKTGTVVIKASFAVYAAPDQGVAEGSLNEHKDRIKEQIEAAYSGTFKERGITFTVSAEINVTVVGSQKEALQRAGKGEFDNVVEVGNKVGQYERRKGQWVDSVAMAYRHRGENFDRVRSSGGPQGADTYENVYAHEFTHLLGSRSHGGDLSNDTIPIPGRLSQRDFNLRFGAQIRMAIRSAQPVTQTRRALEVQRSWIRWKK